MNSFFFYKFVLHYFRFKFVDLTILAVFIINIPVRINISNLINSNLSVGIYYISYSLLCIYYVFSFTTFLSKLNVVSCNVTLFDLQKKLSRTKSHKVENDFHFKNKFKILKLIKR